MQAEADHGLSTAWRAARANAMSINRVAAAELWVAKTYHVRESVWMWTSRADICVDSAGNGVFEVRRLHGGRRHGWLDGIRRLSVASFIVVVVFLTIVLALFTSRLTPCLAFANSTRSWLRYLYHAIQPVLHFSNFSILCRSAQPFRASSRARRFLLRTASSPSTPFLAR